MRLPEHYGDFLEGSRFADTLDIDFEFDEADFDRRNRIGWLTDFASGQSVLHIGCVDHNPALIDAKEAKGIWLHRHLCDSARYCFGVDTDHESIAYVRDTLGFRDVAALDVLSESHEILDTTQWDWLLLPDVLEHIGNPADFLGRLRTRFAENASGLIVSVPNALRFRNFKHAMRGRETINTDHRFWFTPYTLTKLVSLAGFRVNELRLCPTVSLPRRYFKRRRLIRHPMLRDTLVLVASLPPHSDRGV
jgi:hypothetical protein